MSPRDFDLGELRRHVRDYHPGMPGRRSNADLANQHHREHHHLHMEHVHTGPDSPMIDFGILMGMRPEGWQTGKGAIDRTAFDRSARDRVISRGQGLVAYRWRGIDRRGTAKAGVIELLPASVAKLVEQYWRLGWREFLIVPGEGPVPPVADDPAAVGSIWVNEGRRVWSAEVHEVTP